MIDGPVGALEALHLPVADARGIALVCHPNPSQGGTMLNKVVSTLQRTARDSGLATLRFNYRGTGKSAGEHDMHSGEVDDAQAALEWLQVHRQIRVLFLQPFKPRSNGCKNNTLICRCTCLVFLLAALSPAAYPDDLSKPVLLLLKCFSSLQPRCVLISSMPSRSTQL